MPLFEVAVIEHPTKKDADKGVQPRLVCGPKPVIAKDDRGAGLAFVMSNGFMKKLDPQRVEVLVRPF